MEDLFTTQLSQGGGTMAYRIVFENEAYHFIPNDFDGTSFALKREHDEWITVEPLPDAVKLQAAAALDNYLLQQH